MAVIFFCFLKMFIVIWSFSERTSFYYIEMEPILFLHSVLMSILALERHRKGFSKM